MYVHGLDKITRLQFSYVSFCVSFVLSKLKSNPSVTRANIGLPLKIQLILNLKHLTSGLLLPPGGAPL